MLTNEGLDHVFQLGCRVKGMLHRCQNLLHVLKRGGSDASVGVIPWREQDLQLLQNANSTSQISCIAWSKEHEISISFHLVYGPVSEGREWLWLARQRLCASAEDGLSDGTLDTEPGIAKKDAGERTVTMKTERGTAKMVVVRWHLKCVSPLTRDGCVSVFIHAG